MKMGAVEANRSSFTSYEENDDTDDGIKDSYRSSMTSGSGSARQMAFTQEEGEEPDIQHGHEVEIAPDVYGAATYSLIHDCREILDGVDYDDLEQKVNAHRLLFVLCSMLVNYALQFSLLYFSYFFVASPAVARVQNIYKEFHVICFEDDGTFNTTKWDNWPVDKRDQLCNVVFSNFWFLWFVLLLWWMTLLNEFRKTEWMLRDFSNVASTEFAPSMIENPMAQSHNMIERGEEEEERIVRLTGHMRWTLYLFLVVPKFSINLALLIVGTMWLTATDDFADLLLNAVALEFILMIDETVFDAMFPRTVKEHIVTVKLIVSRHRLPPQREILAGFYRSWTYYVVIALATMMYLKLGQSIPFIGVLPGYAHDAACPKYWIRRAERPCGFLAPMEGEECFKYGKNGLSSLPADVLKDMSSGPKSHRR